MDTLETLTQQVMGGHKVTKEEALWLSKQPLEPLCRQADMIRRHFCKNTFDLCTIINGKSGRCSENCKFCAQSAHNHTGADTYPLLSKKEILADAKKQAAQGVCGIPSSPPEKLFPTKKLTTCATLSGKSGRKPPSPSVFPLDF